MTDISKDTFDSTSTFQSATAAQKPPPPLVEWPKLAGVYTDYVRIAGTCEDGATVELSTSPSSWEVVPAIGKNWSYLYSVPNASIASDFEHFQVRQTLDGVVSDPGPVPAFIIRSISLPLPVVTEPPENSFVPLGGSVQFRGTCELNASVGLFDLDENLLVRAEVKDTMWSCELILGNQVEVKFIKVRQATDNDASGAVGRWIGVGLMDNITSIEVTFPIDHVITVSNGSYIDFEGTCTTLSNVGSNIAAGVPGLGGYDGYMVGNRWKIPRVGPFIRSLGDDFLVAFHSKDGDQGKIPSLRPYKRVIIGPDGDKPPPPTIRVPVTGGEYPVGGMAIDGLCEVGAAVELLDANGSKLNDALVVDNKWYTAFTWPPGIHCIRARQKKGGLDSEPSEIVSFTVF